MKRKTIILLVILATILQISNIIFQSWKFVKTAKLPLIDKWYILNLEKQGITLEENEKNELLNEIFSQPEYDEIEITKLAYVALSFPYTREGYIYMFYRTSNSSEEIYEHECGKIRSCPKGKTFKKIIDKYYKWWKDNETEIDRKEIKDDITVSVNLCNGKYIRAISQIWE